MACEVCGAGNEGAARCPRCGFPETGPEGARSLKVAASLLAAADPAGAVERARHAVRKIEEAARAAPSSTFPPLRLAAAQLRLDELGVAGARQLAGRALEAALALAPADRETHLARLEFAARTGSLPALAAEYEARRAELPVAEECLRMIAALERVARGPAALPDGRRWRLPAAGAAAAGGLVEVALVVRRALDEEGQGYIASLDFALAVGLLTCAAALVRDWWGARRGGAA